VLPARGRSKREELVQRFQLSDRGGDDTHIYGHTVQILPTAEVADHPAFAATANAGNCHRQCPVELLTIAQVDFSRRGQHESYVDGLHRIESQRNRYQTILAVKCTVVPSVSRSMVTSCMSACMSWIPRPRWR
jgi:ferredoxin